MVERSIILLALIVPMLLTACVGSGRVEMVPTSVAISDRKPIKVAVVVPDASRTVSTAVWESDACFGLGNPSGPFGDIFVQTLNDRFSRLFEEVRMVRSSSEAGEVDVVFEATLSRLTYKSGCMASPTVGFTAQGTLRVVSPDGREFWRSPRSENRVEYDGMANVLNLGMDVTRRIAGLVDAWVMDLQSLPVARYASGATPAVSGAAADSAMWNVVKYSTVIAEYQRYLEKFPNGVFATLAEQQMRNLVLLGQPGMSQSVLKLA